MQRQYSGTAGQVENAQVAVYLVYAGQAGHAVIDRELYLPRSWTNDPDRLQAAGVPDEIGFATKPALATKMITRALDAGVPGGLGSRRRGLRRQPGSTVRVGGPWVGYVLAVACDQPVAFGATHRADALLRQVPARAWQQISCGKGAKGHRLYDWAFLRLDHPNLGPGEQTGEHWLMVRYQCTGELAFYRCYTPGPVPLAMLVRVVGTRWTAEERFQTSRGLVGWTNTRSAAGAPGIAGSPLPCSPTPSRSSRP